MRLAFVSLMGGLPWGGSEALWSKTAKYALQCGHDVLLSVYGWDKLPKQVEELKALGANIHIRERYNPDASIVKKLNTALKDRLASFNKTYNAIVAFKPDAILISQGESFDLVIHHKHLYELVQKNGIPYYLVCHSHSQYSDIPDKSIFPGAVEVFNKAQRIFFVSKRMKRLTERKLCLKLTNALHTWNPLNLSQLNYLEYPTQETIDFAIVGSLGGSKGHDTLFEVLAGERWATRNWQLNVFGDGYGSEYLKSLSEFFGLRDKVHFRGNVSDAREIWEHSNILLIPSAGEGLPISLVEAMICGRSAVVTDVGGNTEIVKDGINGFVAAAPSVSSYSQAMERAWELRENWRQMGEKARQIVLEKVDLQPEITLYNKLIYGG